MARRKAAAKRIILPDPLFGSEMIAKFINVVTRNGKKSVAEKIVYGALEKVATSKGVKETGAEGISIRNNEGLRKVALDLFDKALNAVRPIVEVRPRRVGGANYQIPMEVRSERGTTLAMRWLIKFAAKRGEKSMALRLAGEILDAISGKGGAIKQREIVHSMAKANQAFAHFRW
ncbi:MAG: 30S ribosomal protein S7 [Coxiella sp. DG_40]|nr:MAG: 30S ribosomal protein S7 [Coxiella sp. DG_40]